MNNRTCLLIATVLIVFKSIQTKAQSPCDTSICRDKPPGYPGGMIALIQAINNNIVYPEKAKSDHIGGKVILKFVIDSLGNVSKFQVLKSVRDDLDQEAIRVTKEIAPFIPGEQCCKKLPVYYTLPVLFDPSVKYKKKK